MDKTPYLDTLSQDELVLRLTLALDGADIGVWDWDLRTNQVQFDARWCEMLGLEHAKTPMQIDTWSSRVHPEDLRQCEADIRAHIEGHTPRYENVHRMQHAQGHWIYILDRGRISGRDCDGRPTRFTGTHADVTEFELAKRRLLDQQRKLAALIDHLPTGAALLDQSLHILVSNRTWLDNLGIAPDIELRGRPLSSLFSSSDCLAGLAPAVASAKANGGAASESLVTGLDGRKRWLRWHVRTWTGLDAAEGGLLFCIENVTAQVENRRAVERERAARVANLALFAGGIAHELNTPLQVILSEAENLASSLATFSIDERDSERSELLNSVESITSTARRAGAIAKALRSIARDTRRDPPAPVSVSEVLKDVSALCAARVSSIGCTLTIDTVDEGLLLWARQADVLQALLGLVHRAIRVVSTEHRWIRLEVVPSEYEIELRVVDGGLPFEPEADFDWEGAGDIGALTDAQLMRQNDAYHRQILVLGVVQDLIARNGGRLHRNSDTAHTTWEVFLPRSARPQKGP